MKTLESYAPRAVLSFFAALSAIPRGSGNEAAVAAYCMDFAAARGLRAHRDAANNVVICKPGQGGGQSAPPLIIQNHLDMVCEANEGTVHNFATDPLQLRVLDGHLYATDTTLGADNGIGVAVALALLDHPTLPHPPLEAVFTTDEEAGMTGVAALDAGLLTGRRMLNMDAGEEDTFCVGCAGGVRAAIELPCRHEAPPAGWEAFQLTVNGLHGGHSGLDIHLGRANAIVLLAQCLQALREAGVPLRIQDFSGGAKNNAIPREATAHIYLPPEETTAAQAALARFAEGARTRFSETDPSLAFALAPLSGAPTVLSEACATRMLALLLALPNGPAAVSPDMPGLVTASNNVGVLHWHGDLLIVDCLLRGDAPERMAPLRQQLEAVSQEAGTDVTFSGEYPGWSYNPASPLLATATEYFWQHYGAAPKVEALHAGLECGHMLGKIPGLDILCHSCNIYDIHTPDEHVDLASLARTWEFVQGLVKKLAE